MPLGIVEFVGKHCTSSNTTFLTSAPFDYGPELLLMPSRFHLAMDTLPSGDCKWWLQVRLCCIQLSFSCPFRLLHTFHLSLAGEALPPPLDTTLLIRASEGL